ncbi:hypothetical protein Ga0080559_TMP5102 (plasmid) [Salipiger profundus]|uniref:Uncharacterized protein n=1 Tax=Salipiger profundus TaxID=1229727 RepID=A0A1U7DE72_9RHOB|nr:hypothetical protein Ga0080559_TMP5102 [Salipiger profundus]
MAPQQVAPIEVQSGHRGIQPRGGIWSGPIFKVGPGRSAYDTEHRRPLP